MKVLVIGGAGFIGSHVVDAYLATGHTVAVFDNFSTGKRDNIAAGTQIFVGDITNATALTAALQAFQPDVVNHHAAQVSVVRSVGDPVEDARHNVLGTLTILEVIRATSPMPKVIYASSGGAMYGDAPDVPTIETTEPKPCSPYGLSKYVAEQYVWLYARLYGLRATVLRYSNVYGPRQDPHGEAGVCAIFAQRMIQGEPVTVYGDGLATRDYVYVGDVAAANVAALGKGEGEACNISTGNEVSTQEVYEQFRNATGYTLAPQVAPLRSGEILKAVLSPDKAKKILGWSAQMNFPGGVIETVKWYHEKRA